jgi:hypothetical protein
MQTPSAAVALNYISRVMLDIGFRNYSIKISVFHLCRVASVREAHVQVMEEKDYGQLPKLNIDTTICSNLCSLLPLFLK